MKELLTQENARYRPDTIGDAGCFNCKRYIPIPSSCEVVEGHIRASGVCINWAKMEPTETQKAIGKMLRGGL